MFRVLQGGYNPVRPVGEWLFQGNANDTSVNGNDGTVTSATLTTDRLGNADSAYLFDGIGPADTGDDLITVTDATAIQNIWDGGGKFTSTIYVLSGVNNGDGYSGRIADKGWWATVNDPNIVHDVFRIVFGVTFSGGLIYWRTNTDLAQDTWYDISVEYNSGDPANAPTIKIDGVADSITRVSGATTGTRNTDAGTDLIIGNRAAADRTFGGKLDNIRLYDTILGTV